MEHIETSIACANHAVLYAQNDMWGLVPIETSNSDVKHAVVQAQNDRSCLGPKETCYSGPEVEVLHVKTTGVVVDPQSLVIPVQKSLFCIQNHTRWLGPIETSNSCAKVADLHAQNHTWGLGPIQTFKTGPKVTVCKKKHTDKAWNQYRLVILVQIMLFCMHKTAGEAWNL